MRNRQVRVARLQDKLEGFNCQSLDDLKVATIVGEDRQSETQARRTNQEVEITHRFAHPSQASSLLTKYLACVFIDTKQRHSTKKILKRRLIA
ncbi:MAG: hypothetical protein CV088_17505 [Nitrospira sp. LK70]|nr:hypothetical protein [Nitrospira sp. LK70]